MSPILVCPHMKSTKIHYGDYSPCLAEIFRRCAETFCKKKKKMIFLLHALLLYQNHMYTDLPLASLE